MGAEPRCSAPFFLTHPEFFPSDITMRLVCALLLGFGLLGCSGEAPYKGDKRYAVEGTVKFDGEPVDKGMISFVGADDPTKQFTTGAPILEGKYSIEESRGPNAGKYLVQVRWSKPTGKKRKDSDTGEMIDETKEVIPRKYNETTELKAEVKAGENKFDFDLKK
jgi:hypothetical protein